jgi:hypothetical protein
MRYCSLDGRDIKADDPVVYDPTWGFIHKEADMPDIGPHTLMGMLVTIAKDGTVHPRHVDPVQVSPAGIAPAGLEPLPYEP